MAYVVSDLLSVLLASLERLLALEPVRDLFALLYIAIVVRILISLIVGGVHVANNKLLGRR